MKRFLLLLFLSTLQIMLQAQDSLYTRRHSFYIASPVFFDMNNKFESFFGIGFNYDFRIPNYIPWAQMGISASIGQLSRPFNRYNKGPFFKIGPKFLLGNPVRCAILELQYCQFHWAQGITFHGANMSIGIAFTGKRGVFFHPKIEYQYATIKESAKFSGPPLRYFVMDFGLGYAF